MTYRAKNPFESLLTPEERLRLNAWPMSDQIRMEGAMVIWEAILDNFSADATWLQLRDTLGTVELRHALMPLVEAVHIGWSVHEHSAGGDVLVPYDWEFVPFFLSSCVDVHPLGQDAGVTLRSGWLDTCRATRGSSRDFWA